MIVRISPRITRSISNESVRLRLHKVLKDNSWFKCVTPFERSRFNIIIDNEGPIILSSSSITEIINDERMNYEYCNYCGHTQKRGLGKCSSCTHPKAFLENLLPSYHYDSVPETALSAVQTVFGI